MLRHWVRSYIHDERAASAVEYGLILGLTVIGLIGAITAMGGATSGHFNDVQAGFE
ncbi:Flp family type IVb pilin [Henriciella litoralis]|uniref:Flp family type IVb pilin n=1 Tax=Henriciella litoralis TaxID=568102 RepID=UPI000A05F90C|nr:Flp family type IVb pilin [Henriciella litoralis]